MSIVDEVKKRWESGYYEGSAPAEHRLLAMAADLKLLLQEIEKMGGKPAKETVKAMEEEAEAVPKKPKKKKKKEEQEHFDPPPDDETPEEAKERISKEVAENRDREAAGKPLKHPAPKKVATPLPPVEAAGPPPLMEDSVSRGPSFVVNKDGGERRLR